MVTSLENNTSADWVGWDSPDYFRLFSEGDGSSSGSSSGGSAPLAYNDTALDVRVASGAVPPAGPENRTSVAMAATMAAATLLSGASSPGPPLGTVNDSYDGYQYYADEPAASFNESLLVGSGSVGAARGSTFELMAEDIGAIFYNPNGTYGNETGAGFPVNCSLTNTTCIGPNEAKEYHYWYLILVLFPILTLFGNVLVILAVCRERTLQTVTNYFIVSLAIADLLVAVVVMPFAVYVLHGQTSAMARVVLGKDILYVLCGLNQNFD
uniref:G-protein coupled receptors family 1 profile domain-containing protein n=1 Tax=Anopheles atroparvus TaxID=41427 RepID=A0A182IW26_ANOAO